MTSEKKSVQDDDFRFPKCFQCDHSMNGSPELYAKISKDGKKRKLGAIPLKESKPSEKALLVWLNEDPSRVAKILASLQMEYQSAVPNEATGFDLP